MTINIRSRRAELLSHLLGPVPMALVLGVAVGVSAGRGPSAGVGWGLLSIGCAAVLPAAVTAPFRKRAPRTTRARLLYILPAIGGAVIGLIVLLLFDSPTKVVALAVALVAGLVGSAVVNTVCTSSNHVAALAGGVTIAAMLVSPVCWLLTPLVVALAWARVASGAHKLPEVLLGAAVGFVASASTLLAL